MGKVLWSSVATVLGAAAFALAMLWIVVRGRVWAWVPFALACAVLVREVRYLQRRRRPREAGFGERRRDASRRSSTRQGLGPE